jgi:hypothetical protein
MNWYIKKDLVTHIKDKVYRLKFEPKGKGNTNPFFLERIPNKCVVCGSEEHLSRHHIVPYQYRKVLPNDYKNSNHFDILCVCLDCHEAYEDIANKFKDKLHKEYDVAITQKNTSYETIVAINGILYVLKEKINELNEKSIASLLSNLKKHVGYGISLEEAFAMDYHDIPEDNYYERRDSILLDKFLANNHTYEDFILMWRNHFLDTMKPKFISKNWLDHYTTFFKKTV